MHLVTQTVLKYLQKILDLHAVWTIGRHGAMNLRLEGTKDNHLYYWLGIAQERLGEPDAARESFERAILGAQEVAGVMYYYDQPADMLLYQGRALERLGRHREAMARYWRLG